MPANTGIEAMRRADELDIDLCIWLGETVGTTMPAALKRKAGGGVTMNDGECDSCPCFEPAVVPELRK